MSSPNIAIVGAGIGGLALGQLLSRSGYQVTIYEQAQRFSRVGAGIQLTPNATKVLLGLGLEQLLRTKAFAPEQALNRDAETGDFTNVLPLGKQVEERYGSPYLFMHRADLHAALEVKASHLVQLDRKLVGLEQNDRRVKLAFADGSTAEAQAVIAADGVHSIVREILFGPESSRFTGRVAYRTTFPAALLGERQIEPARTKWWGSDRHIVIYYVTANRDEVYFVTSQPEPAEWMTPESWSAKGDVGELRRAFSHFHPEVRHVLDCCPEVYKWALLERDPMPAWTRNRVVLLGDACHPMTPYMAQGAASALEDAVVLGRVLDPRTMQGMGFERAFKLYESVRKDRTASIQTTSSGNTWMRNQTDPSWVYGYDAWTTPLQGKPVSA